MTHNLPTLEQLLMQLQQVPYLASKNLYRVAHHFLELDQVRIEQFCKALQDAHARLEKCYMCFVWKEREQACSFCDSRSRDQKSICVVETWHEVYALEKTGAYRGVYHVLGGALSPLEGIGPDKLTVDFLVRRIQEHGCDELILAMNQTPEGEATAALVARRLYSLNIKMTRLARGIPVGSSLEKMDRLTLHKALAERRLF